MVRYETRNRLNNESELVFTKDPIIYVNDYTIGVSYHTNVNSGRCRIESLDAFAFGVDTNFTQTLLDTGNGFAIRIKSASSLLELDSDYIYTGQREIDGIRSDVYVSKVSLAKNISIINEYAFTSVFYFFNFNLFSNKKNEFLGFNIKSEVNIANGEKFENNIPKRLAKASLNVI